MAVMVYDPTKFEIPAGVYTCRFAGTRDKPPMEGGRFKNAGPRMGWRFTIVGPAGSPQLGKEIEQSTGVDLTRRSKALFVLTGLRGGVAPAVGEGVDPDTFVGRLYTVAWSVNPDSDAGNCHVSSLLPAPDGAAPAAAPAAGPPARPGAPPRKAARSFWVDTTKGAADPEQLSEADLQRWIAEKDLNPGEVACVLVGEADWKTAADYGFRKEEIPY